MIKFNGHNYSRIITFDCRIIHLEKASGGQYFTTIPISPLRYRLDNPTKAAVEIVNSKRSTLFRITDDRGNVEEIDISHDHHNAIQEAIRSAKEQELIRTVPTGDSANADS
jgi:hypothetical protein